MNQTGFRGRGGRGKRRPRRDDRPPSTGSADTNGTEMTPTDLEAPGPGQQVPTPNSTAGPDPRNPPITTMPTIPESVAYQHAAQPQDPNNGPQQKASIHYGPSHATARWKSDAQKSRDKFDRIRKGVKMLAPEMFKDKSNLFGKPADIVPRTFPQYLDFKYDTYGMRADELEENAAKLSKIADSMSNIPKNKRQIKSGYGENGKMFLDGFGGPVLMQPTIWSIEHEKLGTGTAPWPSRAELRGNGDHRENDGVTRCGRYLPFPRQPPMEGVPTMDTPWIEQYPMDVTGPLRHGGPSPMEINQANMIMDNDEAFEVDIRDKLGEQLMLEVGNWSPAYLLNSAPPAQQLSNDARLQQCDNTIQYQPDNGAQYLPDNGAQYYANIDTQYYANNYGQYQPGYTAPQGQMNAPMQYAMNNMHQMPMGPVQQVHINGYMPQYVNNGGLQQYPVAGPMQVYPTDASMVPYYQQPDGIWTPVYPNTG